MPPKNTKSSRIPPPQGKDRSHAEFDDMALSNNGKRVFVTTQVPLRTREQMKLIGPLMKKWGYIDTVTPYSIGQYCIRTMMDTFEKYIMDTAAKEAAENAGPQDTRTG
jgi:hypothetical protein